MKKNFEFVNARTVQEAITCLGKLGAGACVVAGGTNVLVDIRNEKLNDLTLVNIRDIGELRGISMDGELVSIGALTTIADIMSSDLIRANAPCLAMAACSFADPTIRNTATIGGNLMKASTAGDMIPPLMVLEADARVKSVRGERTLPVNGIFVSRGKTKIEADELLLRFTFRPQPHTAFMKIGLRKSLSISMSSAAVYAGLDEAGVIDDCRVALGAVSPLPVRAPHTERALLGIDPREDAAFAPMYEAIRDDIKLKSNIVHGLSAEYRKQVIPVLVKRAARLAAYGECM